MGRLQPETEELGQWLMYCGACALSRRLLFSFNAWRPEGRLHCWLSLSTVALLVHNSQTERGQPVQEAKCQPQSKVKACLRQGWVGWQCESEHTIN